MVVDVRSAVAGSADYQVTVADVKAWEERYGRIPPAAMVVAWTGWSARWDDPARYRNVRDGLYHFPGVSGECAEWLVANRDVNGVGIDALSLDAGLSETFPAHHAVLGSGRWIVENLANLDELPPSGAWIVVAPMKHAGGSGGPARVFSFSQ